MVDARSFLDDWERTEKFSRELRNAAKKDPRAHMHDQKVCEVLAEHVECADFVVLTQTDDADPDELSMME